LSPDAKHIIETLYLPSGKTLSFKMIKIEKGTFLMGNTLEITVPEFYMAEFPVTQELWEAVVGENPARFQGKKRPVEQVSWNDIMGIEEGREIDFLNKLNELTTEYQGYRLPSESEWEYAAMGGHLAPEKEGTHYAELEYAGSNRLEEVGWYDGNSGGETKPVGLKMPNQLGLYDLSGNVWEWCADKWHGDWGTVPPEDTPKDGTPWESEEGSDRVGRGGSWLNAARYCRVAYRGFWYPDARRILGFRLALSLQ
jgi:sulfatase modifying factor 1